MRKLIILISIYYSFFSFLCFSQPPIQWKKCYGGSNDDELKSIINTYDHGFILAGSTTSNDGNVTYPLGGPTWIVKIDSSGHIQWDNCFSGGPYSIIQTTDTNYVVAGVSNPNNGDGWVLKISNSGNLLWQKSYGGTARDDVYSIAQTYDGGYVFGGWTYSWDGDIHNHYDSIIGNTDAWIVKINDTGAVQWSKCYGGDSGDAANCIIQTIDSNYVFVGSTYSFNGEVTDNIPGDLAIWIAKLNDTGSVLWSKCYGSYGVPNAVIQTLDGGFAIAGTAFAPGGYAYNFHGYHDYWVLKLDSTGALEWSQCYGGSDEDQANSIIQNPDSTYIVVGYAFSNDGQVTGNHSANNDCWMIKLSSSGSLLWEKCYGGNSADLGESIVRSPDGGYAFAGITVSSFNGDVPGNHGSWDYWVVKITPDTATGISELEKERELSVYPNPTNNDITFHIPQLGNTNFEIGITDVFGREVYKETLTGIDTRIAISKWSEGVYFYEVRGEKETWRGKIIVEK